jgi:hypothetical protein
MTFRRGSKTIPSALLNGAENLLRQYDLGQLGGNSGKQPRWAIEEGRKIWLKVTGADYEPFDVLPIKGPLGATPTATGSAQFQGMTGNPIDDEEFRKLFAFEAGTSTYNGAGTGIGSCFTWFAVLLDKIAEDEVGLAKVTGLFAREITVKYAHHRFARMDDLTPNTMESALSGPFRIWSRHNNLGSTYPRSEWCILEVNAWPAGLTFKGRSNAAIALNATNGAVSVYDTYTGSFSDTGEDIELTNHYGAISASGKDLEFNVPANCNFYNLVNGEC